MKVQLVGKTQLSTYPEQEMGYTIAEDADALTEFAGRSCYQSFNKPNPKTEENEDYLANILSLGHESVLEHSSATFYITGVSRALTHELIRHRHLSFSELSQRFVDVNTVDVVYPPAIERSGDSAMVDVLDNNAMLNRHDYNEMVNALQDRGLTRKRSREAARAAMPNATETRIVVTGNHRAWRDVLKKRWSVHADAEIRELAGILLTQLRDIAPNTYQDIPEAPYA